MLLQIKFDFIICPPSNSGFLLYAAKQYFFIFIALLSSTVTMLSSLETIACKEFLIKEFFTCPFDFSPKEKALSEQVSIDDSNII